MRGGIRWITLMSRRCSATSRLVFRRPLQAGTRDLFLSNAVRFHRTLRRHGIPTELHVFEGMPHGGFGGAPEDQEIADEVRRFVAVRLGLR